MAARAPSISSITTKENTAPNATVDPFWDSTPRTISLPPELELMLSVRQEVSVPPGNPPRTPRPPVLAARRPQCTHITMNRLYGDHRCHICGRVPDLGFVYLCQQDRFLQHDHSIPSTEALPVVADSVNFFEAQAQVAKSMEMSTSVIKQMRDGEYSYDQIEKLLQQRRHVLEIIRRAESTSAQSSSPPSPRKDKLQSSTKTERPAELTIASSGITNAPAVQGVSAQSLPMTPAGTPTNTPSISATATPTPKAESNVSCNFQVCHACRPFFPDRLHGSIDAVYNDELPEISPEEQSKLRVLDANIVNNLGLRSPALRPRLIPPQEYDVSRLRQGDGYDDEESPGCTPTDTSISDDSHDVEGQEIMPCPGRGNCPVWTETHGCAAGYYHLDNTNFVYDPDIITNESYSPRERSNPSAASPGNSSAGSSISLPAPRTEPLTPPTPEDSVLGADFQGHGRKLGRAATVCGVLSRDGQYRGDLCDFRVQDEDDHSSESSFGDEVEVDGGVALTEEAVERGLPDIATD